MNSGVSVYVPPAVKEVQALYGDLLEQSIASLTVMEQLSRQVNRLLAAHHRADPISAVQISNWHPRLVGRPADEILTADFSPGDARITIAREHGFENWEQVVDQGAAPPDPLFEAAVEAVLSGDIDGLREILDRQPNLVAKRSVYGHRATLLHYLAANGVETRRQVVPSNAADIARLLIARGADAAADMRVYGGEFDTAALASSSAHPQAAGVLEGLLAETRTS